MTVTGSDIRANMASSDSLRSQVIDTTVIGDALTGPTGGLFGNQSVGAALAGVTEAMAQNIAQGIESYESRVRAVLEKLNAVDPSEAFKGSSLTAALNNFVEGVKQVSNNYLNRLTDAENQIVRSVASAYASQDETLSGQLNSDTSGLTK